MDSSILLKYVSAIYYWRRPPTCNSSMKMMCMLWRSRMFIFQKPSIFFNNDSLLKTLMNAMAYRIYMSQTIYYILCLYCIFFQWINDSCLCFLLLWQLSEFMLYGPLSNKWYGSLLCTLKCPLHLRRLTGSQPTNEGQRWVFYYFKGSFQVHWVKR